MMKKLSAVIIGAGGRGYHTYAAYAEKHPEELKIVGVAEPDEARRKSIVTAHDIPSGYAFTDWKDLLAIPRIADIAFVCTQDRMHVGPALLAMKKGYQIVLEKPMAVTAEECIRLETEARAYDVSIAVSHVLRYSPFFSRLKEILDAGTIGRVMGIQHNENVGHIHYSHSYVRGNWRNATISSPMILAKSCHDMDILLFLTGSNCLNLSSFGSRSVFMASNKPAGAPDRCLDGCPHRVSCPYYAPKIYMTQNEGWPVNVITDDLSMEGRQKALKSGPYGRCVYACDNDVIEHQVVNFEFENGTTAVFTMSAFTPQTHRTIKIMGEKGEIRGAMERNEIEISDFSSRDKTVITLDSSESGHGGGDDKFVQAFLRHLNDPSYPLVSSLDKSVQSHLMAFAAEESMKKRTVVNIEDFRRSSCPSGY